MSTKIYEAYRTVKPIDAFKLLEVLRIALVPQIKKAIKTHLDVWRGMPEVEFRQLAAEIAPNYVLSDKLTPLSYSDVLKTTYRNQVNKPEANWNDLNFSLTIRKLGQHLYVIPYYGMFYRVHDRDMVGNAIKKLLPELREYGYWNNTDMPDNVSAQEWSARKKAWNKLLEKWDKNYLTLEIVTPDSFYHIDPIWDEVAKKNGW